MITKECHSRLSPAPNSKAHSESEEEEDPVVRGESTGHSKHENDNVNNEKCLQ